MNLPKIKSYDEQCIDVVVNVINRAKFKLGERQNLVQLAQSRFISGFGNTAKVSVNTITSPLALNCEKFISDTIEKSWNLDLTFHYIVRYMGSSQDECSHYFYFEAVFSQPTVSCPIPQAAVSVYFRVEDKHIEPPEEKGVPKIIFRIEGQSTNYDVRFVTLTDDWILAVLQMKLKFFKRIEALRLF